MNPRLSSRSRRRRSLSLWARLLGCLPQITLVHLLVTTAVAAVPLAVILRAARDVEGGRGSLLLGVFAIVAVVEIEAAFWFAFGPVLRRWLSPPQPPKAQGGAEIHWVDEPSTEGITWKQ